MIAIGGQYKYVAQGGRMTGRNGQIVTVLDWRGSDARVEFPDGCKSWVSGRCLRKIKEVDLFEQN